MTRPPASLPSLVSVPTERDLEELRQTLTAAVRRVCPAWLSSEREDIVQTALIRVARLATEKNEPLGRSYLWKVAYTATVDEVRRRRRRRETTLTDADDRHVSRAPGADPERLARSQAMGEAIRGCLEEMVGTRRPPVTLHLLGHSVPEAARLLGLERKKAENLVYRGLADLRRCLEAKGYTP